MPSSTYRIKIDQLPEEAIEVRSAAEAARVVERLLASRDALKRLADDEPVEIKRPDGSPWGRNLTIGAFRKRQVDFAAGPDGPLHAPSIAGG